MGVDVKMDVNKSLDKAINNLTEKPTEQVGKTLSDILYIVFGGISQFAEKRKLKYTVELENFKNNLNNKVNLIPPENRIEPNLQIVGPALENAKFCVEEEDIRDMFENLIAASMNIDTYDKVHPSFSEIIKQMSPRDASNLSLFNKNQNLPIVELLLVNREEDIYKPILSNVFLYNKKFSNIYNQSFSITLLERLGLLKTDYKSHLSDASWYEIYNESLEFKEITSKFENQGIIQIEKGFVETTVLGQNFIDICLNN